MILLPDYKKPGFRERKSRVDNKFQWDAFFGYLEKKRLRVITALTKRRRRRRNKKEKNRLKKNSAAVTKTVMKKGAVIEKSDAGQKKD
jgi:hypothetical protein